MNRVGVISDTHFDARALREGVHALGAVDGYVHLGDCAEDAQLLRTLTDKPVLAVKGNNDYGSDFAQELTFLMGAQKVLAVHGHSLGVKLGTDRLAQHALSAGAQVALYGHTHAARVAWHCGVLLICPGALNGRLGMGGASCALLTLREGQVTPQILAI